MKDQGIEVIYQTTPLDTHIYQRLESIHKDLEFIRVDSELNDQLLSTEIEEDGENQDTQRLQEIFYKALGQEVEASFSKEDYSDFLKKYPQAATALTSWIKQEGEQTLIRPFELPAETRAELGEEAFKELFNHAYTPLKVQVKSLKSSEIPSMIVFNEMLRRWHDMDALNRQADFTLLKDHTLILNRENPIIKKILDLDSEGREEEARTISTYIHDLSMLEQRAFSGDELKDFINRANKILTYL